MKITDAFDAHADALRPGYAPATVRKSRCSLLQFQRELGLPDSRPVADISREDIGRFLGRAKWSGRTRRRHYEALRRFFAWAVRQDHIAESPMSSMQAPSYLDRRVDRPVYTETDLVVLLDACRDASTRVLRARDAGLVRVLWDSGLPPRDLIRLRVSDIDFARAALMTARREMPLSTATLRALRAYLELRASRSPTLFLTRQREPLTVGALESVEARLSKALGRPVTALAFRESMRLRGGHYKRPRRNPDSRLHIEWGSGPLVEAWRAFERSNEARGLASGTLRVYAEDGARLLEYLLARDPETAPAMVKRGDIEDLLNREAARGITPASVNRTYRCLRRFFNFVVETETIAVSPMAKMRAPRIPKTVIRPYSDGEVDALLRAAAEQETPYLRERDGLLITVLVGTGLRAAEVLNLEGRDIYPGALLVRQGKGKKDRYIPLDPHTEGVLRRFAEGTTGRLFALGTTGLHQVVRRLGKIADVKLYRVLHRFRDTFACKFLENGGRVDDLSTILGHASWDVTRRYVLYDAERRSVEAGRQYLPWASRNGHAPIAAVEH